MKNDLTWKQTAIAVGIAILVGVILVGGILLLANLVN